MASQLQDHFRRERVTVTEESDGRIVLRARSTPQELDLFPFSGEQTIQVDAPTNQSPIRPITLTGCREDHHVLIALPFPVIVAESDPDIADGDG